jgi:hypothetical protein
VLGLSLTLVFLLTTGCNEKPPTVYSPIEKIGGDDFTTFVAEKGVPYFSLEHPTFYRLVSYQSMP